MRSAFHPSHRRGEEYEPGDEDAGQPDVRRPTLVQAPARDRTSRRDTKKQKADWQRVRRAEVQYGRRLRHVGEYVGGVINTLWSPEDPNSETKIRAALNAYGTWLRPWAEAAGASMLADVKRRDERVWKSMSKELGSGIQKLIDSEPEGELLKFLLAEQVHYITSLPLDAAQRVHELVLKNMEGGNRAKELADEIRRSGEVSQSRAMLIARTETTRAASALVQVRAQTVGSEGYIWRSAEDSDVRPLHAKLDGTFHRWDTPPVAGSKGERAHAGMIYNCRCYCEPVIPEFRAEAA